MLLCTVVGTVCGVVVATVVGGAVDGVVGGSGGLVVVVVVGSCVIVVVGGSVVVVSCTVVDVVDVVEGGASTEGKEEGAKSPSVDGWYAKPTPQTTNNATRNA